MLTVTAASLNRTLFYVDGANYYHRSPLFPVTISTGLALALAAQIIIAAGRNKINPKQYTALMLFPVPPVIASVAQAFITGYSFMLPATAFSLFTVFLFNQDMTYIDYLSEVYNRRYLELALERKIGQARASRSFSAVMTDLDIFGDINNSFGYITGDDELRVTAKLLLQCAGKKGLVARYGGDEYFLLLDSDNREELEETAESI